MMWNKFKEFLGLPALIGAFLVGLLSLLAFFGFSLKSPAEQLTDTMAVHVVEEKQYHDTQLMNDGNLMALLDSLSGQLRGIADHVELLETKQDAALRGECIENTREQLELQGLILECRRLGIER